MIVVDASLLVEALTDDGDSGDIAYAALAADTHWTAPQYIQVEVTSAVRGRWLGHKITEERADQAVATLNRLVVDYAPWGDVAVRVWELRHNLTAYDAAYIALAEARACRLVTSDRKLYDCPVRRCPVDVVGMT